MSTPKRELIFEAGAELFAQRSYDSVGIRDIARKAGVNSAMISYYFGGKAGLLREIFTRFKDLILVTLGTSLDASEDHYQLCANNVNMLLKSARENRSVYLVGLRELNHDSEELQDLREALTQEGWVMFAAHLERLGYTEVRTEQQKSIMFTGAMGIIFSDYLLGGGSYIDNPDAMKVYSELIITAMQHGFPSFWK